MTIMEFSHVRADTLPENMSYRDDGCEIAASCFACPLPMCKFDDPGWLQRAHRRSRDTAILRARRMERLSVSEVAGRFRISTRTVHRILKHHRESPEPQPDPMEGPLSSVLALSRRSLFRAPAPLPRIWPPSAEGLAVGLSRELEQVPA